MGCGRVAFPYISVLFHRNIEASYMWHCRLASTFLWKQGKATSLTHKNVTVNKLFLNTVYSAKSARRNSLLSPSRAWPLPHWWPLMFHPSSSSSSASASASTSSSGARALPPASAHTHHSKCQLFFFHQSCSTNLDARDKRITPYFGFQWYNDRSVNRICFLCWACWLAADLFAYIDFQFTVEYFGMDFWQAKEHRLNEMYPEWEMINTDSHC